MSLEIIKMTSVTNDDRPVCNSGKKYEATSNKDAIITGPRKFAQANDKKDNDRSNDRANNHLTTKEDSPSSCSKPKNSTVTNQNDSDKDDTTNAHKGPLNDRRPSTTSRFKEKRPEPLKINLNQDIPLDLSVKSAGIVPSGTMSSIFNRIPLNSLAPLDTPRIQWQDNDTLLATKTRLFSSSTNTSQRARIPSSYIGESPPITPGTPLVDLMFSPSGMPSMRLQNDMPHSATLALESPLHSFLVSPFELNKLQILDKLAQSNKQLLDFQQMRTDMRGGPRRSCSSDNLNISYASPIISSHSPNRLKVRKDERQSTTGLGTGSKKTSISPLAMKSFSNNSSSNGSPTKFLYTNQIATTNNDNQNSPTSTAATEGKALTPTSVANATANLLNIHINSPNGNSSNSPTSSMIDMSRLNRQGQEQYKTPNLSAFDQESLDPLISTTYCQQQQNLQTVLNSFNSMNDELDQNVDQHSSQISRYNQTIQSISSTATLNTPTLISPNQMKAGNLCFIPSPTLSPMSSVFELPSPLLMFAPNQSYQQNASKGSYDETRQGSSNSPNSSTKFNSSKSIAKQTAKQTDKSTTIVPSSRLDKQPRLTHDSQAYKNNDTTTNESSTSVMPAENNFIRLITPANDKLTHSTKVHNGSGKDLDHEVDMEIDQDVSNMMGEEEKGDREKKVRRPATVIPQICVSDHHSKVLTNLQRNQARESSTHNDTVSISYMNLHNINMNCENLKIKDQRYNPTRRSWSPRSSRTPVDNCHNERFESSSAPPDIHQRRMKAKVKSVTAADSCFNLNGEVEKRTNVVMESSNPVENKPSSASQTCINQNSARQTGQLSGKPNQGVRSWFKSNQQLEVQTCDMDHVYSFNGARSNSAEPRVHPSSLNKTLHCIASNGVFDRKENLNSSQSTSHMHLAYGFQNASQPDAHKLSGSTQMRIQHIMPNQQIAYSNNANYDYLQQHHSQLHHSISAIDLHKSQYSQSYQQLHPTGFNIPSGMNDAVECSPYSRHHAQQLQPMQHSQQNIPTSFNGVDNLSINGYQRQAMLQNHTVHSSSTAMVSQASYQQHTTQMPQRNFEPCHLSSQENNNQRRGATDNLITTEMITDSNSRANSYVPSEMKPSTLYFPYQDRENRPDSRSSCSLDFTSMFGGSGGSRSASAASSNLAAKKYHCDQCSKSFTRSDMLTRHRRLHSGDRPFLCTECKQEFSRSDHLSTHMRTHTGEKPYKCKLCTYSACRKDMITRHLKVHGKGASAIDIS